MVTRVRAFPATVVARFSISKKSLAGSSSTRAFAPRAAPGATTTSTVFQLSDAAPAGAR